MHKAKYIIAALLAAVLLMCAAEGCAASGAERKTDGRPQVVVTIFPVCDWVRQLAGDRFSEMDVTLLLDSGVDLHSYQPTAQDMLLISECDLFIYVGGESDAWTEDALKEMSSPERKQISLLEALGDGAKEEELSEGMEPEEEEEEDGYEYDEHVWLSLQNAQVLCKTIADALSEIDPGHGEEYAANAEAYIGALAALDGEYRAAVSEAAFHTVLFGDRFPFRYLTDDYGLDYYAAFAGCSAETEASFETIIFLASKLDELGLPAILQIESADGSIAETIRQSTEGKDQMILTVDSMQSRTSRDVAAGVTYLSVMEEDLSVLRQALGCAD